MSLIFVAILKVLLTLSYIIRKLKYYRFASEVYVN